MLSGTFVLPKGRKSWNKVKVGGIVSFRLYGTEPAPISKLWIQRWRSPAGALLQMASAVAKAPAPQRWFMSPGRTPTPNTNVSTVGVSLGEYMSRAEAGRKRKPSPHHKVQFDDRTGKKGGLPKKAVSNHCRFLNCSRR